VGVCMTRVVVGLIYNLQNKILIALRGKHQHQGGLWEFPGGKLEPGEIEAVTLARELKEELGISVIDSQFYLTTKFDYGDKTVELTVYKVREFRASRSAMKVKRFGGFLSTNWLARIFLPLMGRLFVR